MSGVSESARQFMIFQHLTHHVELVPVLTLYCGKGAAWRFADAHQITTLVDIAVTTIVEGVLIQPPAVFTFGIDDKGEWRDIKRQCAGCRTRIEDPGIFIFLTMPVEVGTLRSKGMGINQIEAVFKTWRDFNNFGLL